MKRLLGIASALTCALAAPLSAQALPTYATMIAMDHCQYLSYGWSWDDAMGQALLDNSHWMDDMNRHGDNANRSVVIAINEYCPTLNRAAFNNR